MMFGPKIRSGSDARFGAKLFRQRSDKGGWKKWPPVDGVRFGHTVSATRATRANSYGRPACEGLHFCVPLCPIKALYEAIFHSEKAMAAVAIPAHQAVVTRLNVDESGKRVSGVQPALAVVATNQGSDRRWTKAIASYRERSSCSPQRHPRTQ